MGSGHGGRDSLFVSSYYENLDRSKRAEVVVDTRTPEEIREQWVTEQLVIEQALLDVGASMGWTESQVLQNYFINNKQTLTLEDNERFAQHHFERGTHGVALRWVREGQHYCVKVDVGTRNPFMKLQYGKGEQDDQVLYEVYSEDHSAVNLYSSLSEVGQAYLSMFN